MAEHETEQTEEAAPETTDADAGTEGTPSAEGAPAAEASDEQMAGTVDDKAVELMGESRGHAQGEDPIAEAEELLDGLDMDEERKKVAQLSERLAP